MRRSKKRGNQRLVRISTVCSDSCVPGLASIQVHVLANRLENPGPEIIDVRGETAPSCPNINRKRWEGGLAPFIFSFVFGEGEQRFDPKN